MRTYRLLFAVAFLALAFALRAHAATDAPPAAPPRLVLQLGHNAGLYSAVFSADERLVATAGADNNVKIWDAHTGELLRTLGGRGHCCSFSPDGRLLVCADYRGDVTLWSTSSWALVRTLTRLDEGILSYLAWSPNSSLLAGGIWGDTVNPRGEFVLWDVQTGERKATWPTVGAVPKGVAFSPDGKVLACSSRTSSVESGTGKVVVFDVATCQQIRVLPTPSAPNGLAFSPTQPLLAGAGGGRDGTIRLWNWKTGALVSEWPAPGRPELIALAFSGDGTRLAVGAVKGGLWLVDVATGRFGPPLEGHAGWVDAVQFSHDGKVLLTGGEDKTARLWDMPSRTNWLVLGRSDNIRSIAYSGDGAFIAAAYGDGIVGLWHSRTGALRQVLLGHRGSVNCLAYSPDGKLLATAGADKTACLWSAAGVLLRRLQGHTGSINALAFSPDGSRLATGSDDVTVRVWDTRTGACLGILRGQDRKGEIYGVAFSPDGARLAAVQGFGPGGVLSLFDARTGALLQAVTQTQSTMHAVAFAGNTQVVVGTGLWNRLGEAAVWDAATGEKRSVLVPPAGDIYVNSVALSPDRKRLAVVLPQSQTRIFDTQTWEQVGTVERRWGARTAAFSPDGERLALAGDDAAIQIWDLRRKQFSVLLQSLPPTLVAPDRRTAGAKPEEPWFAYHWIAFTPEGYYASSAGADRYVRFQVGDDLFPAESFQARYYRPDMVQQALAGKAVAPAPTTDAPAYPPLVRFVAPQDRAQVAGETVDVRLRATSASAVTGITFFVNGARVDAKVAEAASTPADDGAKGTMLRLPPSAHGLARTFTASLPLPPGSPMVRIQAVATDDRGLQSPLEGIVLTRPASLVKGRLLGLCVGVSRYRDAALTLEYADRDATDLAQVLNQQRGPYTEAQVQVLTNADATCANVRKALDDLIARSTRTDTVILLFSGHGWRSDERTFYFATHEVSRQDVAGTALPWSDVVEKLTALSQRSRRVIVLLDACHSGSAATNEDLVSAILHGKAGVMVFSSSRGGEVSLESAEWAHGAFTRALLDAAQGKAAPGEKSVTLWDFVTYVRHRVKELTQGAQNPQVPFLQDFDTDAPLIGSA